MSKNGFTIKPLNKKLLKSSKVRAYFRDVEDMIVKEIYTPEFKKMMIDALSPPEVQWFKL